MVRGTQDKQHELLTNLPGLDDRPLVALDVERNSGQGREQDDSLQAGLLALVVLRLGCPVQERDNVLGHLGSGGRSTWDKYCE